MKNYFSSDATKAVPHEHAEMLAQVLDVFSFLDHAEWYDRPNGQGFEDMCELPDLRGRSIHDLIGLGNEVSDLLCRIAPVIGGKGSITDLKATMRKWAKDTEGRLDGERRQTVSSLADWVIRIRAVMEGVLEAA